MDIMLFLTFLAACGAAATTGAMFEPGAWYRALRKPRWTPPDWLFPVAWSVLYLSMAAAAARVAPLPGSGQAMAFWAAQIAFNTLWTPVFFGLYRMGAAFGVMLGLWTFVALTLVSFWQHDLVAGLLFVPYLAWVTVAGALNWTVWRMNPGAARPSRA
jgi:tryptophan-rich sensory protein